MTVGTLSAVASAGPASAEPAPAYDHSKDKGRAPGTHGPLPKGFSTTELSVKFKADREVRLRDRKLVAEDTADAAAVQRVLAKHDGASIRPLSRASEEKVTQRRLQLEKRVGRELPDLNSWFVVTVPKGIESLLDDLNALPSVEIAQARPITVAPVEPLRSHQRYRNAPGSAQGGGVDADYANAQPGGKGDGILVTDIEAQGALSSQTGPQTVAAGDDHSLLVAGGTSLGQVWAWGDNSQGQLGNGSTTPKKVPVQVTGLTNVTAVSAGKGYSVALKSDGTVWAWGDNSQGQLGNGSTIDSATPVQVAGIFNAVGVSAGAGHALAVLSDGTVRAWGDNSQRQLGYGTSDSAIAITVPGLTGVAGGAGTVAAGGTHSVVVLSNGTVKAWGDNAQGQLGDGTTVDRTTPVALPGLTGVKQISSRADHVLALLNGGTVKAWGDNSQGQLGDGTTVDRTSPVAVSGLSNAYVVSAGSLHSAAIALPPSSSLLTVHTWGDNAQGQLGNGTTTDSTTPIVTSASNETVSAGLAHTFGKAGQWLYSWGANGSGQLGDGTTVSRTFPYEQFTLLNAWNLCHEDLAGRVTAGTVVQMPSMFGDPCTSDASVHHGTAVAGVIGAKDDNGVGMAGIAPHARLNLSTSSIPDAVGYAATSSLPGDVILFEVAIATSGGWYPWELDSSVYDQTVLATAAGVTVVEAAGNGGNDLDDPNDAFAATVMGRPDSGAIMIGAGAPPSPGGTNCTGSSPTAELRALSFSTYGSRVDVQAYGACVATLGVTGWKDLTPSVTDPNKMYTGTFDGTSSASAVVAGAVADLQGVAKAASGVLTPAQVRDTLKLTGTPQPAGDPHHIGPRPNLHAAIDDVLTP
ncbi:S8 family serine peptidase [Streptosporangium carneum]|uniref:RCC1 domain-containing protein n=1 Tax=Streptosporangium carneum TaxID=47481 RepID=UPI0031EA083F